MHGVHEEVRGEGLHRPVSILSCGLFGCCFVCVGGVLLLLFCFWWWGWMCVCVGGGGVGWVR